jgi:hypothetical protein
LHPRIDFSFDVTFKRFTALKKTMSIKACIAYFQSTIPGEEHEAMPRCSTKNQGNANTPLKIRK